MRRPADLKLTPDDHAGCARWSRRVLGIWALIVASVIAYPIIHRSVAGDDAYAAERPRDPTCARWDEAASDAIAYIVQGRGEVDLRLVDDAIFRMRRARRNCHLGWTNLACLDYQAVIGGAPGPSNNSLTPSPQCASGDGDPTRVTPFGDPTK
jgi:hypothetical protein